MEISVTPSVTQKTTKLYLTSVRCDEHGFCYIVTYNNSMTAAFEVHLHRGGYMSLKIVGDYQNAAFVSEILLEVQEQVGKPWEEFIAAAVDREPPEFALWQRTVKNGLDLIRRDTYGIEQEIQGFNAILKSINSNIAPIYTAIRFLDRTLHKTFSRKKLKK